MSVPVYPGMILLDLVGPQTAQSNATADMFRHHNRSMR
jgi:hypothetical protein